MSNARETVALHVLQKRNRGDQESKSKSRVDEDLQQESAKRVVVGAMDHSRSSAVCKLDMPLDVKWDMSHLQSIESLVEPIVNKLDEVGPFDVNKARVVGLHGVGGVGKTALTREICNQMCGKFFGKVCHVELGGMNIKEQMKIVLKELTGADPTAVEVNHDVLAYLLKEYMRQHKVFLVLDNICDNDIGEVEKYLSFEYLDGSMVLLVSRSLDILEKGLCIPSHHCMEMPNVDEEGAIDIFLHYARCSREFIKSRDEWEIVKRCVNICYCMKDSKGYVYHPLALKVIGMQVQGINLNDWEECLEVNKINLFEENVHPVFSILRKGYDLLATEEQHIFLDLALIWVMNRRLGRCLRFEWGWLCTIHGKNKVDMKTCVDDFLNKGLLESVHDIEELDFSIHNLYVEFAENEAQAGSFEGRRFFVNKHEAKVHPEFSKQPLDQCWQSLSRIVMHHSGAKSLTNANLKHCINVEVLDIDSCEELEELNVTGMSNLRCIVVTNCRKLERLEGFNKSSNLVILRVEDCPKLIKLGGDRFEWEEQQHLDVRGFENQTSLASIASAPTLPNLDACGSRRWSEPLDVSGLKLLQSIDVSGCENLISLGGIACAVALQELKASRCSGLRELPTDFSGLNQLRSIDVSGCENLISLNDIACAEALQELKAFGCSGLRELPGDFSKLEELKFLDVSDCTNLTSLGGIARAKALQELKASGCSWLKELPGDFSKLKGLKSLDVSGCKNLTSLGGIARAEALQELKASGCPRLWELPGDFSGLKELKSLDVSGCCDLTSVGGIACAEALQELKASGCSGLRELPGDFSKLKELKSLDVSDCTNLTSLGGIARAEALQELKASRCSGLWELPGDFSKLKELKSLDVSDCTNLTSLGGIARAKALQELKASGCPWLRELPGNFSKLKELKSLDVSDCWNLTSLGGIVRAKALEELKASGCSGLWELPGDFSKLKELKFLDVSDCTNLTSLGGIARAKALQKLKASGCPWLRELPGNFSKLKELKSLDVSDCTNLTSLGGIARAKALEELKASGCSGLRKLPGDFSGLKELKSLDVSACKNLGSLGSIARAEALQELKASGCPWLRELPGDFSKLKKLKSLDVSGCKNLTSLGGIARAEALQELKAFGCLRLWEFPGDFSLLKQLKSLDVGGCWNLTSLGGIARAEALQELKARGCFKLRELPSDYNGLKHPQSLDDQSHGADMAVNVDNVEFQVGTNDMDMEGVVDVDDDRQECKDELSSMADFQDFQAANAVGVPSLSTVVLEDQTHKVEMPDDVDNVESILTTSTDVGGPSSLNASHGYPESSGTMWALTGPDCLDSSGSAQGNAVAMEQLGSYLRLVKHCLEAVQSGTSSLKFNIDQCGYLADKLQMVVRSASAYLDVLRGDPNLSMDVAEVVEIFKFLRTLAKQIESFVHGCCQQSWIQSAMMLTNVWEYVASVGFNLELCRAAFCRECGCLSLVEVEEIHKVEVEVVKKKAFSDVDALSQKILLEGPSLSDEDKNLSFYLLRRLIQVRPIPGVILHLCDGSIAYDGGWIGRLYKWVKPSVQLGRGASGTVHKAMWLGTLVARKTFFGQQNPDFMKEVEILSALSHPNVMSMFCSGKTNQGCCAIVMELMDEDLHMLMERRLEEKSSSSFGCPSPFPILEAVDLMLQIGEGGKYLHDQGIAHRDLKAMNILAKNLSGEDLDGYVHVKVADFGLSKTKEKSIRYSTMSVNVGSNRWMAPEIIRLSGSDQGRSSSIEGPKHPLKRDIYSYGMVCFEILTGHVPFPSICNEIEVKRRVLQGGHPELPEDPQQCPLLLRELIESCWSSNPEERPTFMAICLALKYLKYLLMRSYCQGQKIDKVS